MLPFLLQAGRTERKWHPGELVIPSKGFALGGTYTVTYRRRPRKVADIPDTEIELTLECQEKATYSVGTETRTETETVVKRTLTSTGSSTPNGFEASFPIEIPSDAGGPTLQLLHNRINWEFRVRADQSGPLPTRTDTFPFVVMSTLATTEIQDARPQTGTQSPQDGVE